MSSPEVDLKFTVQVPSQADEKKLMGHIMRVLTQRYRKFANEWFIKQSRGGGKWKPLKPGTIKAKSRRPEAQISKTNKEQQALKQFFSDPGQILVFTGELEGAMNYRGTGMVETYSENEKSVSVKIAFAGKLHKKARPSGKAMTIAKLAAIHHFGAPTHNLPARPILVDPDEGTLRSMDRIIEQAIETEMNL